MSPNSRKAPLPDWRDEAAWTPKPEPRSRARRDRGDGDGERKRRSPLYVIFYVLALGAIVGVWAFAFRSYFDRYDALHPEITWALPWIQSETEIARGVLLWEEQTIQSPRSGEITYPMGRAPIRVFKGAVIAKIRSGGKIYEVKSPSEGYFTAALDGVEGQWRYSELWLGGYDLPRVERASARDDGAIVKQGEAIGKIVPQPQTLRFIGTAPETEELVRALEQNRVMLKMDELDSSVRAELRVHDKKDGMVKMYISMPWFPPQIITSRNFDLLIETDTSVGVVVPSTSLARRGGSIGAYVIKGSRAVFKEVKGRAVEGDRYLITDGVGLGDAVIVDGSSAHEGRVNLW